ncbi:hypothetical protein [Neorhodopirellula pilleata]|uniref:Uncharacterized protein n=1 Tax=Neorhodopirellula pilleata TaxID=2714738 RepID=A0A5C6A445_9BACT|nr:hypothetical protein [Neorhodopirellula pilleata]TWT94269.1 hypothetical protein Pla100_38790 [Neorhodopirellula pilleata]
MQDKLLEQIETIANRYRKLRMLKWSAAVIAIGVLLAVIVAIASDRGWLMRTTFEPIPLVIGIVAFTFIGLMIVRIVAYRSFQTPNLIAREVERAFPDLGQKLLTAVEQTQSGRPLGFLQQRVVEQAYLHATKNPWRNTVAESKLRVGRLANSALAFVLVVLVAFLIFKPLPPSNSFASNLPMTNPDIVIEPGSIELERGSSLVVTADWGQTDPSRLPALDPELLTSVGDQSPSRMAMRRNLADPVWAVAMTDVRESFDYRVESVSGTSAFQSEVYRIDVFEYPKVTRTDAALTFPAYTHQEPTTVNDTVRVTVAEGTDVTWLCTVNQPLESAVMLDQDGASIPMTPHDTDPLVWSANMTMRQSNVFAVRLIDTAGRENQYTIELTCKVLANQPPKFDLTGAGDAIVSALEEFPVAAKVTDDFGVIRSGVRYTFDRMPEQELSLGESSSDPPQRKIEVSHLFEFERFDAVPDQLLAYSFWAEDIGPDGEVRHVDSDLFFAEVRPFEEIYRQGQQPPSSGQPGEQSENTQKAEKLLELQKQIIQATWNQARTLTSKPTDKMIEDVAVIAESQNDAIAQLDELKAEVRDPESIEHIDAAGKAMNDAVQVLDNFKAGTDADQLNNSLKKALTAEQNAYSSLLKLRAREFEVSKSQSQQSSSSRAGAQNRQRQLDELELDEDENRYETQATAEQSAGQSEQRETRQILSRLRELAQRQQDLNKEIAQLQSALQLAKTEEEKEEVQRLLKRLREQQEEILRQADETQERMQSAENSETMRQASEQLQETRENLRQAGEAMDQQDAATALSQGKRAERELKELRDEVRTQAADQFQEAMRQMQFDANELAEQQQEISEQMQQPSAPEKTPGLRADQSRDQTAEDLQAQQQRLENLLEQMQETVSQSETAEPLLAEKLYESFRETQQRQTSQRLDQAEQLWKRGFDVQANEMNESATEAIDKLKSQIDSAAENILASETESLREAMRQLESLQESLDAELGQEGGQETGGQETGRQETGRQEKGEQQPNGQQAGEQQSGEQQSGGQKPDGQEPSGQEPSGQKPGGQQSSRQQPSGQQPDGQEPRGEQPGGQPTGGQPSPGSQSGPTSQGLSMGTAAGALPGQGGAFAGGPLTGDGFREFSDGLRDVEEMVQDPELRSRAAQIRQRAREVRAEFQRNSKTPQWDLVEEMIATPLRELRRDVSEEWMLRSGDRDTLVPIDRDPVPEVYSDSVRQYYENLSSQSTP